MMILIGKVIPRAIGKYKPGLASGTAVLKAAGTAMYEAPAPKMAKSNRLPVDCVSREASDMASKPLTNGST